MMISEQTLSEGSLYLQPQIVSLCQQMCDICAELQFFEISSLW